MPVEFFSWNGDATYEYVGRVEDGQIVDGYDSLAPILLTDSVAEREGVDHPLEDEDYLVRRYAGISFTAKRVD